MRSIYNGKISEANLNEEVELFGWVNRVRNHGALIFIDLRDTSGIVQLVNGPDSPFYELSKTIHNEYVLQVRGKVVLRESPNLLIPSGKVEVEISYLTVLNKSKPLPIDDKSNDEIRLKYRYLDLRREEFQKIFKTKAKAINVIRNYLEENNFIECETPILCKSTPEGARDFLVPSRIYHGEYYALPQSPQILKQLLMVAGFDRYYQIAKCFRDEDLRADRQPEFSQVDIETSFLDQNELLTIIEGMIKAVWKEILKVDLVSPFPRLKWDEAIRLYGSDKPDTRFNLELEHLDDVFSKIDSPLFKSKCVVGIKVHDKDNIFTRKKLDELTLYIKKHNGDNLLYIKYQNQEFSGSIAKLLDDDSKANLPMNDNDIYFITTGTSYVKTCNAMGSLRNELGRLLNVIDKSKFDFKWVVEFPLFEIAEDGSISSSHHPFTRPLDEHKKYLEDEPLKAHSYTYDLVASGYEVGGGSLRIYDEDIQQKVFKILNISKEAQRSKFGYLLDAMEYGCPPHGGIAFGVERLSMLLVGTDNIRDVILFPKTTSAQDLMLDSPSKVDDAQLDELGIQNKK